MGVQLNAHTKGDLVKFTRIIVIILMVVSVVVVCEQALAATLTAGAVSATPGSTDVQVPISLSLGLGESASAVQCNVTFDSAVMSLTNVTTGAVAATAGKTASFSIRGAGQIKIVVAGLNQTSIGNGVVANLVYSVSGGAYGGSYALSVLDPILASPSGMRVTCNGANGSIEVVPPPGVAATVSTGAASATPGSSGVSVPVSLSVVPGGSVSRMQFDITVDPAVASVADVTTGGAAATAGKTASHLDLAAGQITVVVDPLDQNGIRNGVVANLIFNVLGSAFGGSHPISISNTALTRTTGTPEVSSATNGSIEVVPPPGVAATVSAGTVPATPGSSGVSVPVSLSIVPGAAVSRMQFDVAFNSTAASLANVTPGAAAVAAGKTVSYSNLGTGLIRVVVDPLDQNVMRGGVVANLIFNVLAGAQGGSYPISIFNTALTRPSLAPEVSSGTNGSLEVVAPAGIAATLSAATVLTAPDSFGNPVSVSLSIVPGASVSKIQFDVTFDPTIASVAGVNTGAAAVTAGKTVSYSNLGTGLIRVVVDPLNQNAIGNGVVAKLFFDVFDSASAGSYPISIFNTVLTRPTGTLEASSGTNGSLDVAPRVPNATPSVSAPASSTTGLLLLTGALVCFGILARSKANQASTLALLRCRRIHNNKNVTS